MRPTLTNNKVSKKLWVIYFVILVICIIGIAAALHLEFFQEERIEANLGKYDSEEEEDEYNDLKEEFKTSLFTNNLENLQNKVEVEKINEKFDIVVTAYTYNKSKENCNLNVSIPYININKQRAIEFNHSIRDKYKAQAEEYEKTQTATRIIYTVEYKSYIQNNILSLVIRCNFKEGSNSQKTTIETFNYDLINDMEVSIDEILELKAIQKTAANNKIKKEIKKIQEQNQALIEQGYNIYQRDYNSDIYKIENVTQYFLGKDGMFYAIFAYGNNEDTNDMDIVIFK